MDFLVAILINFHYILKKEHSLILDLVGQAMSDLFTWYVELKIFNFASFQNS